jgi:hypothetical protein
MRVFFGRTHGEKTLGKIIKVNPTRAKVETLENRGNGRGCSPGSTWVVPYTLMSPADGEKVPEAAPKPALTYSPFQSAADVHILQAINCVYGELSPERLTCDGELSRSQVDLRCAVLQRQLKGLFLALGREVTEEEAWDWDQQRQAKAR